MLLIASAFIAGVLLLHQCVSLPSVYWTALLPCAILAFLLKPAWRIPLAASIGFLWALIQAHSYVSGVISADAQGQDIRLVGVVAGVPTQESRHLRFEFVPQQGFIGDLPLKPLPSRIRLSWYESAPVLRSGERWALQVRLKRANGFMNPGGFDYETWLYTQGIQASGYVRRWQGNRRLAPGPALSVDRTRLALAQAIDQAMDHSPNAGVISALTVGLREGIPDARWQLLVGTGTNHLMAISGLHVGWVAALVYFLFARAWARWPGLCLYWPAPRAAALAALCAALVYATLAGWSIPTQRAVIMLAVVMGAIVLNRPLPPWRAFALALVWVALWDSPALMSAGFWLSFSAVAVILYAVIGRLRPYHWLAQWGRMQTVIALGLLPVSLWFFQRGVLVAPLANLIAVPWVSIAVVPPALLASAVVLWSPALGAFFLSVADHALNVLWPVLEFFYALPHAQWYQAPPPLWAVMMGIVGALMLLAPRGLPGRALGLPLYVSLFLFTPSAPKPAQVSISVLDVGQGLAVVARTGEHTLVYDTGPRFSAHFDAGSAVILPYLRSQGVQRIDRLIISHGDNDHSGGALSLMKALPVETVYSSVPERFGHAQVFACEAGQRWQWEGVEFELLHPTAADKGMSGNNRSCVVQISSAGHRVLLPGDIEAPAERDLLRRYGARLASDVLVAPHHGSMTSSTTAFVRQVAPTTVVVAAGYRNRWGFPKAGVMRRYAQQGAQVWVTSEQGAVRFTLSENGVRFEPGYRIRHARFWRR